MNRFVSIFMVYRVYSQTSVLKVFDNTTQSLKSDKSSVSPIDAADLTTETAKLSCHMCIGAYKPAGMNSII